MAKKDKNPPEELNEVQEAGITDAQTADGASDGIGADEQIELDIDALAEFFENSRKLEAELKEEKDKYLRLLAEYENYRKRSQKEREGLYADVRADTIQKILPVYDNLARALSQETEDEAFYKGVEMTMCQLEEIMAKLGVVEIPAVGETFDPERHNAVMHIESEDHGAGEITEEFEKGFMLGDRVIRFSMVKVAN